MTPFQRLFDALRQDVLSPRNVRRFEEARSRHPALGRHATIAAVLEALESRNPGTYTDKEALVRALIAEQQGSSSAQPAASSSSFWASVLLVACYPMLGNLRARIAGTDLPPNDLDQLVLATFLQVVSEFPLDRHRDRTFMRLRQQTRRQVFRYLAEHQHQEDLLWPVEMEVLDKLAEPVWPADMEPSSVERPEPVELAAAVILLVERAAGVLDGMGFDLVTATLVCGRRIQCYIRRTFPRLVPEDERRLYQSIKRRHSRAMGRLRGVKAAPRGPHACQPQPWTNKEARL